MSKEYPWGKGTPTFYYDATTNDSDKTFTVPAGKVWALKMIRATFVNSATVGDRRPNLTITPFGAGAMSLITAVALAASATGNYLFSFSGCTDDSATANHLLQMGFPEMILSAGSTIRVYDLMAIDAAADDLTVTIHYVEYDV